MCNACEDTFPKCFILKRFKYLGSRMLEDGEISAAQGEELLENLTVDEAILFNTNLYAEQGQ